MRIGEAVDCVFLVIQSPNMWKPCNLLQLTDKYRKGKIFLKLIGLSKEINFDQTLVIKKEGGWTFEEWNLFFIPPDRYSILWLVLADGLQFVRHILYYPYFLFNLVLDEMIDSSWPSVRNFWIYNFHCFKYISKVNQFTCISDWYSLAFRKALL